MTTVVGGPVASTTLRQAIRRHPELPTWGVVGAAWTVLILVHGQGGFLASGTDLHHGVGAMPTAATVSDLAAALPMWMVMTVAMMVPGAVPAVRHVTSNSLRRRRQRAAASFLTAYLSVWIVFGFVAILVAGTAAQLWGATTVLVAALAVAALWQLLPTRQRWLDRCHRTVPLPPRGRLALFGCLRFGMAHGQWCFVLCWPMMTIMTVMPHPAIIWMAVLTALITGEKWLRRPYRWSIALAFLVGAVALNLALAG